jgi:hypothetical protein
MTSPVLPAEPVSGDSDGSVRLWNMAEGKQLEELKAQAENVRTASFA